MRRASLVVWVLALGLDGCSARGTGSVPAPELPELDGVDDAFGSEAQTVRFLSQATFGARPEDAEGLTGRSASRWFLRELEAPATLLLPRVRAARAAALRAEEEDEELEFFIDSTTDAFWKGVLRGEDQLRQRMAWALSQIFVVSNGGGELLTDVPEAVAHFEDLLIQGALGNYRDLLESVTYAPAMAYYLTYLGNQKADPSTGRQPDENYAREILQLFSIGVVELDAGGRPVVRAGRSETYRNEDVTGLAKVFTGLDLDFAGEEDDASVGAIWTRPLVVEAEAHSLEEKRFLGTVIPADTLARDSIRIAIDAIAAHPNVGPFIGRQLIQRFVTSAPMPAYVERVARAFDDGRFVLPNGSPVGTGRRGDLTATLAAVLFDVEARRVPSSAEPSFGKLREPVLRLSAFFRAFEVGEVEPIGFDLLLDSSPVGVLNQHPYRAKSVFNFYRPGYVAPGTTSGAAGLTAPELQLVNASSVPGYANTMFEVVFREGREEGGSEEEEEDDEEPDFDRSVAARAFLPRLEALQDLSAEDLIRTIDLRLTYGQMSDSMRSALRAFLNASGDDLEPVDQVRFALWMTVTSPDFIVQR